MYQDGVTEVRANRQQGCWTVRYAAKATNGGSIDALALATAIAAGDADLLAKIIATNARIDYALITSPSTVAINTRTTCENPFGANTPVMVRAEFYHATLLAWVSSEWIYAGSTSIWGCAAAYVEDVGINLMIGAQGFASANLNSGSSLPMTANYNTASSCRIHVWKVTA
ncbi:hypothetical protein AB4K05_23420 [Kluyvera sp. STS39-E]|uniref:hypothetical protein n=1 Tax=Kluyvera sp. STS39-E TaxID=3234748 RepID=UPI0034C6B263